jgi:hypothetical protein
MSLSYSGTSDSWLECTRVSCLLYMQLTDRQGIYMYKSKFYIRPNTLPEASKVHVRWVLCGHILCLMLPGDHFVFILYNIRCQVLCGSCKSCPYFTLVFLYFSGPSGSLMPALISVENWVPFKPVLGGVRDVARIHYPSCTDSIKQSLQFFL